MKVKLSGKSSGGGGTSHKVYSCLMSQSGTSTPTQIILENTIGLTLTWSRLSSGSYRAYSDTSLDLTKTFIYSSKNMTTMENVIGVRSSTSLQINFGIEALGGSGADSELNQTLFTILSYE